MKKHIKKIKLFLFSAMVFFMPLISFAQTNSVFRQNRNSRYNYGSNYGFGTGGSGSFASNYVYGTGSTITDIIFFTINLINQAVILVVALALLFFFWGVAKFVLNSDDVEKRVQGKSHMIWGIIALFVMLFVWQIVNILANTFF
ncbi:hypothetical protein HON59_00475 [bacterium]|nr:hypothetical protein [bacterium]